MKKIVFYLIACVMLAVSSGITVQAQKKAPVQPVGCVDPTIRAQADAIKQHYTSQGFTVYRDAMINMESMVPFPVVVQLMRGQLYQIIFVGHPAASTNRMTIYDGGDNKLDEKFVSRRHDKDATNYIIYQFVPERTDAYLFEFMTRLKNESMCGSVCIIAADRSKQQIEYKPYMP